MVLDSSGKGALDTLLSTNMERIPVNTDFFSNRDYVSYDPETGITTSCKWVLSAPLVPTPIPVDGSEQDRKDQLISFLFCSYLLSK